MCYILLNLWMVAWEKRDDADELQYNKEDSEEQEEENNEAHYIWIRILSCLVSSQLSKQNKKNVYL